MKLIKTETKHFKKGQSYKIEDTVGFPPEYFRKPMFLREDPMRKYAGHELKEGVTDDFSDLDVCVKSFKIVLKWYE